MLFNAYRKCLYNFDKKQKNRKLINKFRQKVFPQQQQNMYTNPTVPICEFTLLSCKINQPTSTFQTNDHTTREKTQKTQRNKPRKIQNLKYHQKQNRNIHGRIIDNDEHLFVYDIEQQELSDTLNSNEEHAGQYQDYHNRGNNINRKCNQNQSTYELISMDSVFNHDYQGSKFDQLQESTNRSTANNYLKKYKENNEIQFRNTKKNQQKMRTQRKSLQQRKSLKQRKSANLQNFKKTFENSFDEKQTQFTKDKMQGSMTLRYSNNKGRQTMPNRNKPNIFEYREPLNPFENRVDQQKCFKKQKRQSNRNLLSVSPQAIINSQGFKKTSLLTNQNYPLQQKQPQISQIFEADHEILATSTGGISGNSYRLPNRPTNAFYQPRNINQIQNNKPRNFFDESNPINISHGKRIQTQQYQNHEHNHYPKTHQRTQRQTNQRSYRSAIISKPVIKQSSMKRSILVNKDEPNRIIRSVDKSNTLKVTYPKNNMVFTSIMNEKENVYSDSQQFYQISESRNQSSQVQDQFKIRIPNYHRTYDNNRIQGGQKSPPISSPDISLCHPHPHVQNGPPSPRFTRKFKTLINISCKQLERSLGDQQTSSNHVSIVNGSINQVNHSGSIVMNRPSISVLSRKNDDNGDDIYRAIKMLTSKNIPPQNLNPYPISR